MPVVRYVVTVDNKDISKIKKIKTSTAATVGNMACGGVKSYEAGKISREAYQGETK